LILRIRLANLESQWKETLNASKVTYEVSVTKIKQEINSLPLTHFTEHLADVAKKINTKTQQAQEKLKPFNLVAQEQGRLQKPMESNPGMNMTKSHMAATRTPAPTNREKQLRTEKRTEERKI
jgi:hypothetical protein